MRRLARAAVAAVLAAAPLAAAAPSAHAAVDTTRRYDVRTEDVTVPATPEADGTPVNLDATLYLPAGAPKEPAVLLAHGFGGSKADLDTQARGLAARGYVVGAFTARGFGRSGGYIHLDSPDFEIADGRKLLDGLAGRPEVLLDAPGDPRVAVAGGSYGGAFALLLAGTDRRVDAVLPQITWNDLRQALLPQFAVTSTALPSPAGITPDGTPGVFKKGWAGVFFGSSSPQPGRPGGCGRFAPDVCAAYQGVASTGRPDAKLLDLLAASSPARVLNRITAPTLLVQGQSDSLFPLSEGEANARGIAANGTPVKVVWYSGGHDSGGAGTAEETTRIGAIADAWLDRYLKKDGSPPDTSWEVTVNSAAVSSQNGRAVAQVRTLPGEPGVTAPGAPATREVPLTAVAGGAPGAPASAPSAAPAQQTVEAPAGGSPAAVTVVPGLGQALSTLASSGLGSRLSALPGQTATFSSAPLTQAVSLVGSSRVTVHVAGSGNATLFAQLYDVDATGQNAVLPSGLVSPLYLTGLTPAGRDVDVALPAVVRDVAAGHRLRLVISTTDQAYALPATPAQYRVSLAGGRATGTLTVPDAALVPVVTGGVRDLWPYALALVVAAAAAVAFLTWYGRRTRVRGEFDPALADVPLSVEDLGKAYGDGYRAVSDLSFRVQPGWVLGLLGPNGAGKTTTLRMLMGLIRPSEGRIRVFGHTVAPGAPVLSRVGAFVEGPGFLPHVSGLENLRLYWAATGRPLADAHLDEALEIAGLGDDVQRRVKTYSQGMRQRLAIAQAMLGLPDLLVLDEPTNGLDPPQIREMREVLARYAATGRTVVVSSHLLSEVEQTCDHVVVMHRGRLVAEGEVGDLVGSATVLVVDVDDPVRAADVASALPGARDVEITATGLTLALVGTPRGDLVRALVEAGLSVERVAPQRGLEEAFLQLVGES